MSKKIIFKFNLMKNKSSLKISKNKQYNNNKK